MTYFGTFNFAQVSNAASAAEAAYGKVAMTSGWKILNPVKLLGLGTANQDLDGFYQSVDGRAKAGIYQKGNELIVSIRGTDGISDLLDYFDISISNKYFQKFDVLLTSLQKYVVKSSLHVTFTGHSLGGAAVNIIQGKAESLWGGVFNNADYIAFESPVISSKKDEKLLNFGVENDLVYHLYGPSWNSKSKASAIENLYFYGSSPSSEQNPLSLDDTKWHSITGVRQFLDTVAAIKTSEKFDFSLLSPKSYILVDKTDGVLDASDLAHPKGSALYVIGEEKNDKLYGANFVNNKDTVEFIFGMGGADRIEAKGGDDTIYGEAGDDFIDGGSGADEMFGGDGNDIFIVDNKLDRTSEFGGQGDDTVKSSVSYSLKGLNSIENLTLVGEDSINGTGNEGDNIITGNSAKNVLKGLGGDDSFFGGAGPDTIDGGDGYDTLTVDEGGAKGNTILSLASDGVTIKISNGDVVRGVENILFAKNVGNVIINGNIVDVKVDLGAGNDHVTLNSQTLVDGGSGNDFISFNVSGSHADGGSGKDTFHIEDIPSFGVWGDPRPGGDFPAYAYIDGFDVKGDKLDLSSIDANLNIAGNQAFFFSGYFKADFTDGFSNLEYGFVNDSTAGSLTIYENDGRTQVILNRDGDQFREFVVDIEGKTGNFISDIIL